MNDEKKEQKKEPKEMTLEEAVKRFKAAEREVAKLTTELKDARKAARSKDEQVAGLKADLKQAKIQAQDKLKESQRLTGMLKKTLGDLRKSGVLIPMDVAIELVELLRRLEDTTVID